jgi:WXG100 family type VII secretion target
MSSQQPATSGVLFHVNTEQVEITASRAQATAAALSDETDKLRRYVHALLAEWLGPSAQGFQLTMSEFDARAQNMIDALGRIATSLHQAAANYVTNERVNNQSVTSPSAGLRLR